MSWSGSTFSRALGSTQWQNDASSNVGIEAGIHDAQDNDLANGIDNCINKNGANSPTANLSMGGFKHTNVADATAMTQYATLGQIANGAVLYAGTSGGSANAQTLSPTPAIAAYVTGQQFRFVSGFTSTSTLTLAISGLAAKNCLLLNSGAPFSSLIFLTAGSQYEATYDGTNFLISDLLELGMFANDAGAARVKLFKSRGATFGTNTIVQNGDALGQIDFYGANGTGYERAGFINCAVDATPGASADMPGKLQFATSPDASATPAVRMTIDNAGNVMVATTSPIPAAGNVVGSAISALGSMELSRDNFSLMKLNRKSADGNLVEFLRDGASVGIISVAAGVVTYGAFSGSHWSQFSEVETNEILVGTVLESIDQMCIWDDAADLILPKVKVSDTVASNSIYGVFGAWDYEWTQTQDLFVISLGAFMCRVSSSETVSVGDLLESNGDGTAKVQSDNLIKSTTIGKVTSSQRAREYDDGSYCVPTVLCCG